MAAAAGLDRAAVLSAAEQIANRRGLDALTLAELAATLKIKPPSLYNHVAGMAGLRRELKLLALRTLGAAMSRATIGKAGDDAIFALAAAYRSFVKRHPGLYPLIVSAPDAGDRELTAASDEILNVCIEVLGGYHLDRRESLHAIRAMRSTVHGFAALEAAGGFGIPLEVDESFKWAIDALVNGFKAMRRKGARASRSKSATVDPGTEESK